MHRPAFEQVTLPRLRFEPCPPGTAWAGTACAVGGWHFQGNRSRQKAAVWPGFCLLSSPCTLGMMCIRAFSLRGKEAGKALRMPKAAEALTRSGFAESDGFGKMHKNKADYKRGIGEFFETLLTNLTQHGTM